MPETNDIRETDTAAFFPADGSPTRSVAGAITECLDTIEEALQKPLAPCTDITENAKMDAVIERPQKMCSRPFPKTTTTQPTPAELTQTPNVGKKPM